MSVEPAIAIRPYEPADLDALIAIFLGAIREVAAREYSQAQVNAWAQADRDVWALRRLGRPTWVALMGREVVGFANLEPNGHLDMMYVHPAHQGVGVASALLESVLTSARSQGLFRIFTEASITARGFFERRGFRVMAAQSVELRGQRLTNFRMERYLERDPNAP